MQITIRLFGAFRNYSTKESITLNVAENSTIQIIRENLIEHFKLEGKYIDNELIFSSILATDNKILELHDTIKADTKLAILPPVCGG